jgi:osmotically inducible lipoprotein OsmB
MKQMIGVAVVALTLAGCADMTATQQRTLSGGALGAVGGTAVGAIAGNAGMGAVIGAGVGLVGGYVYDQHKQSEERAYARGVQDGSRTARR